MALFASLSVWAAEVTLTEDTEEAEGTAARWYVNMPAGNQESTLTLSDATIPIFKVYDDGGKNGVYSKNCMSRLIITAPTGYVIQLSGRIKTETGWDKLTVHDGNDTSAPILLDNVNGNNSTWITVNQVKSSGQSMTLYFYSDQSAGIAGGLDLTVTLRPAATFAINLPESFEHGTITCDKQTAAEGQTVTLTVTPDNGYVLETLTIATVDANTSDGAPMMAPRRANVDYSPGENGTYTFEMPNAPVTINATFKKKVPTAIDEINADSCSGQRYNLMGQPVGKDYRGIVIEDGKKLIVK